MLLCALRYHGYLYPVVSGNSPPSRRDFSKAIRRFFRTDQIYKQNKLTSQSQPLCPHCNWSPHSHMESVTEYQQTELEYNGPFQSCGHTHSHCHSVTVTVSLSQCHCQCHYHTVIVTVSLSQCCCHTHRHYCHSLTVTVSLSVSLVYHLCPLDRHFISPVYHNGAVVGRSLVVLWYVI